MKKICILLILSMVSIATAEPIDFSTLSTVATSYGQVAAATNTLTAYQGNIYYSTYENGTNAAKVYQYNPTTGVNTQFLAADTSHFNALRTIGSSLYMSDALGNVYVYNGSTTDVMTGTPFSSSDHAQSMAEFNGTKYFGTSSGKVFRYDDTNFTTVYEAPENRAILSLNSWQKNGRIYASIQSSSGYTNDGWTISSNTGNTDSWETILTGVHHTDLFLPTEDYLYAAVMDNVSWYNSTIRKSSDGISFSVISQSSGNIDDYTGYKMAFGAFSYDDIAYFFENSYTGTGSIIMDNGGIVSQVPNTNLAFMQATELNGTVYALAADEPFESGNVYLIATPEPATLLSLIDINPDTVNMKSHGMWITAFITLPDGFDVGTIDTSSIAITSLIGETCDPEYTQEADLSFTPQVGDRDEDGILDLTVKFDRQVLLANLCLDDVSITIEGELTTGELFSGSDSIRIIDRGK